jgi:hypothetical protein
MGKIKYILMTGEQIEDTIDIVDSVLAIADKHRLEVEVMTYALMFLKENPELSIEEALNFALEEWDL